MKRQIRLGVWETNSSTTHCCFMLSKDLYDEFEQGGYIYKGGNFGWKDVVPEKNKIYTKDEVKELIKNNYEYYDEINENPVNEEEEEAIEKEWDDTIWEAEFISESYIFENEDYETFKEEYETPSGDKVVAFGYYGYN